MNMVMAPDHCYHSCHDRSDSSRSVTGYLLKVCKGDKKGFLSEVLFYYLLDLDLVIKILNF